MIGHGERRSKPGPALVSLAARVLALLAGRLIAYVWIRPEMMAAIGTDLVSR